MYNKLFTKILDSSIWLESTTTRIVWVTLIAIMDESGFVGLATVGNVANRARVTLDEAKEAIRVLESPDGDPGEQEHEGKRIERVPGGWMVLNAKKYREMATRAMVQEQTRVRVARHREKRNGNAPVTPSNEKLTRSEAESEARSETRQDIARNAPVTPKATRYGQPLSANGQDKALDLRAGSLLNRYAELFIEYRKGAKYHNRMHLDFDKARELVRTWADDARLEKLAILVLTTDEEWISRTDRGFAVFAARATWADDRLAEWESRQPKARA